MTPQPDSVRTLTIDGQPVGAHQDQTILDVAREHGIAIPTLCHLDGLPETGACRLCLVEVKGVPRPLPSCITRVEEGLEVTTNSPQLVEHRKMVVELLFAERNHVCAVCVSNGHCELQAAAQSLGIDHVRFPYRFPKLAVDASNGRFVHDQHRCLLCSRCVRVCAEVEGAHSWDVSGRGADAQVIHDLHVPWGRSDTCTGCGKCVQVCPTGALSEKGVSVAEMAKRRQFLPYLALMRERGR